MPPLSCVTQSPHRQMRISWYLTFRKCTRSKVVGWGFWFIWNVNGKSAGRTSRVFRLWRPFRSRSPYRVEQTKGRPEKRQWRQTARANSQKAHWRPESRLIPGTPVLVGFKKEVAFAVIQHLWQLVTLQNEHLPDVGSTPEKKQRKGQLPQHRQSTYRHRM
jgi:hypothetical protein